MELYIILIGFQNKNPWEALLNISFLLPNLNLSISAQCQSIFLLNHFIRPFWKNFRSLSQLEILNVWQAFLKDRHLTSEQKGCFKYSSFYRAGLIYSNNRFFFRTFTIATLPQSTSLTFKDAKESGYISLALNAGAFHCWRPGFESISEVVAYFGLVIIRHY